MDASGLSWTTQKGIYLPANSSFPDRAPTATWTKNDTGTTTVGQAPGPDSRSGVSASQAFGLTEPSGTTGGTPRVTSDTSFTGTTALWRLTWFAKPYGPAKRFASMYFENGATTNYAATIIELTTGLIVGTDIAGSYNIVSNQTVRYPNGWFKVYQYSNLVAETVKFEIDFSDSLADITSNGSYTGDGLSGVLLWGIDVRLATDATG